MQKIFATSVDVFSDKLAKAAGKLKIGDPTEPETDVGPLISQKNAKGLQTGCGKRLKTEPPSRPEEKLSDTCYGQRFGQCRQNNEDLNVRNFGPSVSIYPYDDVDVAIAEANSLPVSFQAAVFTKDLDFAMRCYQNLDATAVMVNEHTAFRVDWMHLQEQEHPVMG